MSEKLIYGTNDCLIYFCDATSEKLIYGTNDCLIYFCDATSGKLIYELKGHEGPILGIQSNSNTLVSCSSDHNIRIWDLLKGTCTHIFSGHTSSVTCLQIVVSQNTNLSLNKTSIPLIITGSDDFHNKSHDGAVCTLAAIENTLVSGSKDGNVRVWNIMTGECVWNLQGDEVYSVALDYKSRKCFSGSIDGKIKVWNIDDGTNIRTFKERSNPIGISNGCLVTSVDGYKNLHVWDISNGNLKYLLGTHSGVVCLWSMETGNHIHDLLTGINTLW
ncbi:12909_t:CDS:2 [Entrophospora sp. SA101]|nr:12909_t:CDS:2 [Entrophospora sp. SA101]